MKGNTAASANEETVAVLIEQVNGDELQKTQGVLRDAIEVEAFIWGHLTHGELQKLQSEGMTIRVLPVPPMNVPTVVDVKKRTREFAYCRLGIRGPTLQPWFDELERLGVEIRERIGDPDPNKYFEYRANIPCRNLEQLSKLYFIYLIADWKVIVHRY